MAAVAAQPKVEKKIMDEKIAKVREVVKNISTNDIVLALHNFELDVARTIHAFCEGGSEVALGDWERTGGAKKRNQKKKSSSKGGAAMANASQSNNSGTTTPSVASSLVNCSNVSSATNLADKLLLTNGSGPGATATALPTNASVVVGTHQQQQQPSLLNERGVHDAVDCEVKFATTQNHGHNHHHQQQQQHQFVHPDEAASARAGGGDDHLSMANHHNHHRPTHPIDNGDHRQRMDAAVGGGVADSFGLADYQSQLVQNQEMLEREVSTAQDAICQRFKELRDVLAAREQRLVGELAQCRTDGQRYFDARFATLRALIADSGKAKSGAKASFVSRMEKFNAKKTDDLEVALTARFLCDNNATSAISVAISQLGTVPAVSAVEPTPPPAAAITQNGDNHNTKNNNNNRCGEPSSNKTVAPAAAAVSTNAAAPPHPPPPTRNENVVVKRSNSPSSLVSSVGEDSGLGGQISPVNHVEKGQPVQVEENGIVLKSDTVSADQLAEIQRQIAETLKAKGIDPSVLGAGFGTATTVAARRRPPPANAAGARNGPSSAAARGKDGTKTTADGQRKQQQKQPNAMNNNSNNGGEKRK
ncbi:hypothetical protein niasHT_005542 [Heterodera trifolii]|uniref:Uncharacterized protein n=1 Tax=Heterodera trifolii TaxID=157864 RepID=A0ABD2LT62_9BILA